MVSDLGNSVIVCTLTFLILIAAADAITGVGSEALLESANGHLPHQPATILGAAEASPINHGNVVVTPSSGHSITSTPPPAVYDEQLGMSFTQNSTKLAYNVTVIAQTDVYGYGPAYFLNALSDKGYWYQVGISYDWLYTSGGFYSGFAFIYEVWNAQGQSIYPVVCCAGLFPFSVNSGDSVLLSLYFNGGNVYMYARDWDTGAISYQSYSAQGATTIVGTPNSYADSNGFFSGPMTEWYHVKPYFSNELKVVYSDPTLAKSSAWMWIDEYVPGNGTSLFFAGTPSPVSYSNPKLLQPLSSHGATEYSSAYEFITGSVLVVPLTFSYSVVGGGSGYSPPALSYISNGNVVTTQLTLAPSKYLVDQNSRWNIGPTLNGSTARERWATNGSTSGNSSLTGALSLIYYHQFAASFSDDIRGGGSGYSSPNVTGEAFGSSLTRIADGTTAWFDAGSSYVFQNPLSGSTQTERWDSASNTGTVSSSGPFTTRYYHQYAVDFAYGVVGGGSGYSPPLVSYTSYGTSQHEHANVSTWPDARTFYTFPASVSSSSPRERWVSSIQQRLNGTVESTGRVVVVFQHQLRFAIAASQGGSVVPPSGWFNASQTVQISSTANEGWILGTWEGSGVGSYTGTGNSTSVTALAPINETAVFYPSVRIAVDGSGSVGYSYTKQTGTVEPSTRTLYVPPSTDLRLRPTPNSFLYQFNGWTGIGGNGSEEVTVVVGSPLTIRADFGYNLLNISLVFVVASIALVGSYLLVRRRKTPVFRDNPS
jgi:hypothetical protein